MTAIDERVVAMKFDNAQFERGVQTTMGSLNSLNKSLQLQGGTKGLQNVAAAGKNVKLDHIATGVQDLVSKFGTLNIVGVASLVAITQQALQAGKTLIKSLTIDPLTQGFREYETNLNSIQTIMANTGLEGKAGLAKVTEALDELNTYSDKTIYSFSEMAKNIGTFTAAGVDLDKSTAAIKGIANVAALSGANSEKASRAMYQLSQALSSGKVNLEDWNSVVQADMGGKIFQESLKETARVHGVAVDQMIKEEGSFRLSLQRGWLSSEILTETLAKFTGDLTASQLKAIGYNDKQIAGILKMGKTAQAAAQDIKTFSQLISTLQEGTTSGWARTWQLLFGDFDEAKVLWSQVNDVVGGFITRSSEARNKVIGDWKEMGGRTVLIDGISNAFNTLMEVITPIGKAFRQIFPATTGQQLYGYTVAFRDFFAGLRMGEDTMDNIRRTAAGFFAVIGIGWDIIKGAVGLLFDLVGVATEGSGGFLEFTAKIGDFLVRLREAIHEGDGITKVFKAIGSVLSVPLRLIGLLGRALGDLVANWDADKLLNKIKELIEKLGPLENLGDIIRAVWSKVTGALGSVWKAFGPLADKITDFFAGFGIDIKELFTDLSFDKILSFLNTGIFAALTAGLLGFMGRLKGKEGAFGDSIFEKIHESIDELTTTLNTMQNTLRAAILLQIAAAIGILTLSVVALSKVDADGLTRASIALAVMFTQLAAAMLAFEKAAGWSGVARMPLLAAGLILLGIAINILVPAVKSLAELDWEELAKGLGALTVMLGLLIGTVQLMPNDKKLLSTGVALIALSVAIKLLASSVTDLSGLSWEEMSKGLTGVGALLLALGLFTKFAEANKGGLAAGAGLLLLAVGIKVLASAMQEFTGFSWEEIGRGLAAMAGSLAIVTAALMLIPPTAPLAAASVLIVAISLARVADALEQMGQMSWGAIGKGLTAMLGALTIISAALFVIPPTAPLGAAAILLVAMSLAKVGDFLQRMSELSWEEIGKAMTVLAGSLLIIGVAVTAMTGAVAGAAALLIVAASLAVIAPILIAFSLMSWDEILRGLTMLAGAFTVIGVAGLLLTPVVPTLLGLGAAILLIGAGAMLAGVGMFLFATGLTALSVAGTAATVALVAMVSAMLGLLPMVGAKIGEAVVAFANTIATAGPAITNAIVTVLEAFMDAIVRLIPKIQNTMGRLLVALLQTLLRYVPTLVDAGLRLLTGILNGIANNIYKIVTVATKIITNFLRGISDNIPKITNAGADLIIKFVNSLAKTIESRSDEMGRAGGRLATAIVKGMVKGLASGSSQIASAARNAAKAALDAAKNFLGINSPSKEFEYIGMGTDEGFALGIDKYDHLVTKATESVGAKALDTLTSSLSGLSDAVSGDIDMNPVITPVLDLSGIKQDAKNIEGFIPKTPPISVSGAYNEAKNVSFAYRANRSQSEEPDTTTGSAPNHTEMNFVQNNYSPKALSPGEIYRNTKNQLSVAKEVLTP